jgi:hypothetical protein
VGAQDFQLEELVISEPIGLPFHGLDFVVGSFQGTGGDAVVVVGQDTGSIGGYQGGKLLQNLC